MSDRAADQPENVTIDAASYSDEELIGFVTRSAPRNVYIIPEKSADAAARAQTLAERLRHESQIIATISMGDPQYPAGRRAADVIILVKGTTMNSAPSEVEPQAHLGQNQSSAVDFT